MKKKYRVILKTVGIEYLENSFSVEELEEMQVILKQENMHLKTVSRPSVPTMCLEELFAQIKILLSSDILQGIYTGIIASGLYGGLKNLLKYIFLKFKNRTITKVQGDKIEEVSPVIHFEVGKLKVILPIDISQEKYEYFLDKLFESLNEDIISHEQYAFYNEEKGIFEYYDRHEIAMRTYRRSKK